MSGYVYNSSTLLKYIINYASRQLRMGKLLKLLTMKKPLLKPGLRKALKIVYKAMVATSMQVKMRLISLFY